MPATCILGPARLTNWVAAGAPAHDAVTDYQVFSTPSWLKWRVLQYAGDVCAAFDFTKLKVPICSGDVVDSDVCLSRLVGPLTYAAQSYPIVLKWNAVIWHRDLFCF